MIPDLGADLLRVYSIDHESSLVSESGSVVTPPGSGPRHGAFLKTEAGDTYFFLHFELSNDVVSYKVRYENSGLTFEEVSSSGTFGDNPTPEGAAAAETIVSVSPKFSLESLASC